LTLELKVAKKDKGQGRAEKLQEVSRNRKGHENPNGRAFHGKEHKGSNSGLSKWRPTSSLKRSTWMLIG